MTDATNREVTNIVAPANANDANRRNRENATGTTNNRGDNNVAPVHHDDEFGIPEENARPYDYDTDPWHFWSSSHFYFAIAAIIGAIFIWGMVYLTWKMWLAPESPSDYKVDPQFGKKFTDTISLEPLTTYLPSQDKGDFTVNSSMSIVGHYLKSEIQILAHFPASPFGSINQSQLEPAPGDKELGKAINSLHQRLIIRRMGGSELTFDSPLEFLDFEQTGRDKCACASTLINKSFLSLKFITFTKGMSMEHKVAIIRKNESFDMSSLPAVPKTGIVNATKFTSITHKYLNCSADYQATEIVKIISPNNPSGSGLAGSEDPAPMQKDNSVRPQKRKSPKSQLNSPQKGNKPQTPPPAQAQPQSRPLFQTPKPNPSSCRHLTEEIDEYESRNIPDTIISVFFCH